MSGLIHDKDTLQHVRTPCVCLALDALDLLNLIPAPTYSMCIGPPPPHTHPVRCNNEIAKTGKSSLLTFSQDQLFPGSFRLPQYKSLFVVH